MKLLITLLFSLSLFGCETEECRKLNRLQKRYEAAKQQAEIRVKVLDRTKKRAERVEQDTKKYLTDLGLELSEKQLKEVIDKRVAAIKGATVERGVVELPTKEPAGEGSQETKWTITWKQSKHDKALAEAERLIASPPLMRFGTLLKEKKGKKWVMEIVRADVDRLPINFKPPPRPKRKSPDDIPQETGFCGAGEMRAKIKALEQEIETLEGQLGEVKVLMPTIASYEGLGARAKYASEVEGENRRLVSAFLLAVKKSGVKFKGIGVEGKVVVLEIWGNQKDRLRFEKTLDPNLLQGLKVPDASRPGVVRMMIANHIEERRAAARERGGMMIKQGVPGADPAQKKTP